MAFNSYADRYTDSLFRNLALKLEFTGFPVEDLIAVGFNVPWQVTACLSKRPRIAWNYSCQWPQRSLIYLST